MLLRSSSTPILNSWIPHHYYHSCTPNSSKDSPSPSPDRNINELNLPRTKCISTLSTSCHDHHQSQPTTCTRTLSDIEHHDLPPYPSKTTVASTPLQRLFLSSGLDEVVVEEEGGGDDGGDSGRISGVSGGGSGYYEYGNKSNNDHGRGNMDAYYLKMIEVNPGNPLLLGNYARFLKEVHGDLTKAEEYCGRAILASPSDPDMLSLYGDIIWQTQGDAQRAESYFDQAVKTAPDDCYVLASYAKFLWDAEDEDGE